MNALYTFKQSQQHPLFYLFILILLILILASGRMIYVFIGIPLFIFFFRDYRITEMHTLTGNGTIAIATIKRLVVKGNKVIVYYRPVASEKNNSRTYYLRTPKAFVDTLVEINPAIEVSLAH